MAHTARDTYLETQIRTATPQKLRLMLIDGALRTARQAIECWDNPQQQAVRCNALASCHDILTELCASIRADQLPVAQQVQAIYQFLFRHLADATSSNDCQKMREVISVLEEERETWRQLCEVTPEPPVRNDGGPLGGREITARDCPAAPTFSPPGQAFGAQQRISLEA